MILTKKGKNVVRCTSSIIVLLFIGFYIGLNVGIVVGHKRTIKCMEPETVAESTVEVEITVPNEEYPALSMSPSPALTVLPIHYDTADGSLWIYYDGEWQPLPDRVIYRPGGSHE